MIVDFLLAAVQALITWPASLIPSSSIGGTDGLSGLVSHLGDMNYFLPISEVFAFVLGVVVIFPALAGVSLVIWIVALIRGGSSRA